MVKSANNVKSNSLICPKRIIIPYNQNYFKSVYGIPVQENHADDHLEIKLLYTICSEWITFFNWKSKEWDMSTRNVDLWIASKLDFGSKLSEGFPHNMALFQKKSS